MMPRNLVPLVTLALLATSCTAHKAANNGRSVDRKGDEAVYESPELNDRRDNDKKEADEETAEPVSKSRGVTYLALSAIQLTPETINQWVEADKLKRGVGAANYRYAYIPAQFLSDPKLANYARIGLSKAINSVAIDAPDIVAPEDVSEGHGVVFALDLSKYWGAEGVRKWEFAAAGQRDTQIFAAANRLDLEAFDPNQPVAADRLTYNLLHGGIYNRLIDTPEFGRQLNRKLGVGVPTEKLGIQNAITFGPRYLQRRALPNGKGSLWESFDDFNGERRELIWIKGNPVPRFRGDGMIADYDTAAEVWHHMPNGLIAYYIWGNGNQERNKAERQFVVDPLNTRDGQVLTGFCIFCHAGGVQAGPNDMWKAIEQNRVRDVETAKLFWTPTQQVTARYAEDAAIFQGAMRKIVTAISGGDDAFNEGVITAADGKEPCYVLIGNIIEANNGGDVTEGRNGGNIGNNDFGFGN